MEQTLNEEYLKTKDGIDDIKLDQTGKKRKCAIFVMVQNESLYLPIWLKYYSKYFAAEDIFVFDHRSTDGCTEECGKIFEFRSIKLDYSFSFDHEWFQFVANYTQKRLLECYEYVLFTDIDEIIFPDLRKYGDLAIYINGLEKDYVRCKGYELIHLKDKEPPFDANKPILSQRRYWYRNKFFGKTLLSKKALGWNIGFHKFALEEIREDNSLFLVHLHKLDFDICRKRSLERSKLRWRQSEIKKMRGWQNRIEDSKEFNRFYYGPPILPFPLRWLCIRPIPAKLKESELF